VKYAESGEWIMTQEVLYLAGRVTANLISSRSTITCIE
jgi:hypothetical protein